MKLRQICDGVCAGLLKRPRLASALLLFLGLVCLRASILANPPHWDGILGPFAEATWLKNNHFDYWRLIHEELRFPKGGAAVYVWSVIPTIYALLLNWLSPVQTFVVLHLANLLLAAIIAVVLYGMLRDLVGVPRPLASLTVAAMMVQPTFAGQVDAIKMEIPVAACIILSADAMLRNRPWRACAWSVAGLFVKDAALLVCCANLAFALLLIASGKERPKRWRLLVGAAAPIALRFAIAGYVFSFPELGAAEQPAGFIDNPVFLVTQLLRCVPDVVLLFAITLVMLARHSVRMDLWTRPKSLPAVRERLTEALERLGGACIYGLIMTAGFVCLLLILTEVQTRYFAWCLPFFFLTFAAALHHTRIALNPKQLVMLVPFLVGALNGSGRLYPGLPPEWGRSGELLERSREYIRDIRSNQRIAEFLERNAGDRPIVVTCPMDRILTLPEVGYVTRPLNVYTVWTAPTYAPVKSCAELSREDAERMLLVYKPTVFDWGNPVSLKPRAFDRVLYSDQLRGAPAIVYELRPGPGEARRSPPGARPGSSR